MMCIAKTTRGRCGQKVRVTFEIDLEESNVIMFVSASGRTALDRMELFCSLGRIAGLGLPPNLQQ